MEGLTLREAVGGSRFGGSRRVPSSLGWAWGGGGGCAGWVGGEVGGEAWKRGYEGGGVQEKDRLAKLYGDREASVGPVE